MSAYYGKHGKPEVKKYKLHGRTKQSQKDQCDINKLLEKAARQGSLSHLDKYQPKYGDWSGYDFEEHIKKIADANTIFEDLPAEVKKEFNQSTQEFFEFVTNPENSDKLPQLLPKIANQGNYFPPVGVETADAAKAAKTAVEAPEVQKEGTQEVAPQKTPEASQG